MSMQIKWIDPLECRRMLSGAAFNSAFAGGYVSLTPGTARQADAAVQQADGKIVVAGHTVSSPNQGAISVSRYNADGSIDSHFGGGKLVVIDPTPLIEQPVAMAQQADGKIVLLVRELNLAYNASDFLLLRINADGSIDKSFGINGVVSSIPLEDNGLFIQLAIIGDKIELSGTALKTDGSVALQYTSKGLPDSSFGKAGLATIGDGSNALLAEAVVGGELLIVSEKVFPQSNGINPQQLYLEKLTSTGALDPAFGVVQGPKLPIDFNTNTSAAFDGTRFLLPIYDPVQGLVALKLNGTLDTKFGKKGYLSTNADHFAAGNGRIIGNTSISFDQDDNGNPILIPGSIDAFTPHGKPDATFRKWLGELHAGGYRFPAGGCIRAGGWEDRAGRHHG